MKRAIRAGTPKRVAELEAELALPPFPEALRYLWRAFSRIRNRVNGNGYSMPRITMLDLDAFNRLSGLRLLPWEIEIIELLDDALLKSTGEQEDEPE